MKRVKPGATFECTVDSPTTGLVGTITVKIEDGIGATVTPATTSGIVESPAGSGIYNATLTAPVTGGYYVVVWDDGTHTPAGMTAESVEVTSTAVSPGTLSIRDHIETGLSDDALNELVAQMTAEVESRFGTDDPMTVIRAGDFGTIIRLQRPASSITSVVEKSRNFETIETLDPTLYTLSSGGRTLYRHQCTWSPVVVITYTPVPEAAMREGMIVDLVKLALAFNGLESETIGDYSYQVSDNSAAGYESRRQQILGRARRSAFRFA